EVKVDAPTYETKRFGTVSLVDTVATHDAETGESAIFLVNRSQTESIEVTVDTTALGATTISETHTLADSDIHAKNTLEDPERITTHPNDSARLADGALTITLPPVSWTAIALS